MDAAGPGIQFKLGLLGDDRRFAVFFAAQKPGHGTKMSARADDHAGPNPVVDYPSPGGALEARQGGAEKKLSAGTP